MKAQTTNRRWLAGLTCVCAAALALWACKEDNPTPDPPTVTLAMSGATTATDNVAVSRADGTGDLQWPQGKTLGRTFTVSLSTAAPSEVTVALSLVRSENIPAGSVALSPETVRIAAGQTSGTATVSGPASTDFAKEATEEKTYGWTVAVSAVQGITAPATLPRATVAVTVPACEKKEEPKETCDKTQVKITSNIAGVAGVERTETQCVEVTYDSSSQTYTFKSLKIEDVTTDWSCEWVEDVDGGNFLFGDCGDYDQTSDDKCWLYSISGREQPTVNGSKVTKFKASIGKLREEEGKPSWEWIDIKIGEISIGED